VSEPQHPARAADPFVRVGAVLFAVGVVAIVATILPLATGGSRLPLAGYLLSLLAPLGLGVALWGVLRTARLRGRRTRASAAAQR